MTKEKTWEERLSIFLMKITGKYDKWKYAINLYHPLNDFIKQEQLKLIDEIELAVVGEELENTKEEENADWFYGYGYNHKRQEVITALKTIKDKYK